MSEYVAINLIKHSGCRQRGQILLPHVGAAALENVARRQTALLYARMVLGINPQEIY
jgi:hypothetical protein